MTPLSHRHHFLPQGAQRPFCDERGKIAVVGTGGECFETTPLNVGLERDLYLRVRPSGEKSDDIERVSLGTIEDNALPVLQAIEGRWPLQAREKLDLATYMGVLFVRGPRWFKWHREFARSNYIDFLEQGEFQELSQQHGVSEQEIYEAHVGAETDPTYALLKMLQLGAKVGSTLGSMTWALLKFPSPCLALADHPLVLWPLQTGGRFATRFALAKTGLVNLLEVRLPLAPDLALLAMWGERPDPPEPIECVGHHARNLNAFSMAEAERHWIHRPGAPIPRGGPGPWMSLSTELIPSYSISTAVHSKGRNDISRELNARLGDESREVKIRFIEQKAA